MSSSSAKPCAHHTVAVVASAFAIYGRANVPAAARPNDPRSTVRLVRLLMLLTFPVHATSICRKALSPLVYYRAVFGRLKWLSAAHRRTGRARIQCCVNPLLALRDRVF